MRGQEGRRFETRRKNKTWTKVGGVVGEKIRKNGLKI